MKVPDSTPSSRDLRPARSPGDSSAGPATGPRNTDHLQAILQAIPDLIWLKDSAGIYLSCNRAFEAHWGAPEAWVVGRTDYDFVDRSLADAFRHHDQLAMAADGPTSSEQWLTSAADGRRGLFLTIKTPMSDAAGTLVGVLGLAREITVRKEAEAQLLASELRYRRLFESARDGILILDAETGLVVDVNPYLIERLGFTRAEFLGKKIWELGFFRDIVASKASFAELQRNEYVRYEDKPLETAAGLRLDVEFVSNVYLVAGTKVIQCNIRDITARKAAERLLREQNEILSNSHEGVMIVDLTDRISLWNPAAGRIFGWTAAEALGQSPEHLLGLRDAALVSAIHATVEREGFWNGELAAQARDGRKLTIDCRITLVRDESGRPRARLKFLADITEKKLLEAKFLRVQRLEAVGTLAGGVAHDLNNLLTPVLMAASMLKRATSHPEELELLDLIECSACRGAEVIRQLMTFSRGIEGDRVQVQVRHLIKEMASIVRETFPRNITLEDRIDGGLWAVVADATQLHQVLMNLCVNARDAMSEGGTLTLTAKNVQLSKHGSMLGADALDGPYLLLTVRDTGDGIPPEIINRIFEPFFTTKGVGQGTGLGLSTVLGIVRSHGGFVTAYSEFGFGSTFHVYLPAVPDGSVTAPLAVPEDLADGGGETVLVVDDEEAIVTAVRLCLERGGYRVLTARNGQDALQVFANHRPPVGIVVTDVMMPVMDGLKLACALHQLDPNVRVIASSGLDLAERHGEAEAGMIAEFLYKPCQPSALLAAVRRQQNRPKPARP